jgi:hypothetical protein
MAIPRPPARIRRAAKLEFSSNLRSRKPEAGHVPVQIDRPRPVDNFWLWLGNLPRDESLKHLTN